MKTAEIVFKLSSASTVSRLLLIVNYYKYNFKRNGWGGGHK